MALGTDHITTTTTNVLIPELWGVRVNDFFRENLVFADFFTDRSDELAGGGDILHTPNITEMTAEDKTVGSQVVLNAPTETKIDLTINTHKHVAFVLEDAVAAKVKKSYRLQDTYAQNAGFTVGEALEDAIGALFKSFSNTVGASTTNLADSDILAAIATMATNKVPGMKQDGSWGQDVAFFLHPNTFYRQIQSIDKYSLAQNTPVEDPKAKRPTAMLQGLPVFVSANVPTVSGSTGRANLLAHRDAIHWARSTMPTAPNSYSGEYGVRVAVNYVPEYIGYLVVADMQYGVIENRDSAGVTIYSHATKA